MTEESFELLRRQMRLLLETDALLGLRHVPISTAACRTLLRSGSAPAARGGRRAGPAEESAAARPARSATPSGAPGSGGVGGGGAGSGGAGRGGAGRGGAGRGGAGLGGAVSSAASGWAASRTAADETVGGGAPTRGTARPSGAAASAAQGGAPGVSARKVLSADSSATAAEREALLQVLNDQHVRNCRKCELCSTRTQTVFGQGSAAARLVFVGEGPGFEEDRQGLAFVGRAGQLLTRMIEAMGLTRDEVYICNVVKCRPPQNRTPALDEIAACSPYLMEQLQIIRPEVICALGAPAAQTLLRTTEGIGRLRGRWQEFRFDADDAGPPIAVMPTYHPAYLLRNPADKNKSWADLQMIMQRLELPGRSQAD